MKKQIFYIIVFLAFAATSLLHSGAYDLIPTIETADDLAQLLHLDEKKLNERVENTLNACKKKIDDLIAIPTTERTFENTAREIDGIGATLSTLNQSAAVVANVYDRELTEIANKNIKKINYFITQHLSTNEKIYVALKEYAQENFLIEHLSDEQKQFVTETLSGFAKCGLNLPQET